MPLLFNYKYLTPLISRLRPELAYKTNSITGRIGKALDRPSFRLKYPASDTALQGLTQSLNIGHEEAEKVIKRFLSIETRILLEHLWLARGNLEPLPQMIDMDTMNNLSDVIRRKGPLLLLSAHTAYYFLIPWALHALGNKVAYITADPGDDGSPDHMLKGEDSIHALSQRIPVVFTNERNTVNRCRALLKDGYTVIMIIDLPGYKGRGIKLTVFNNDFWIPAGCKWIYEGDYPDVISVFSYITDMTKPYRISFSPVPADSKKLDLQRWAGELEDVVRHSPESWLGWFYLHEMR